MNTLCYDDKQKDYLECIDLKHFLVIKIFYLINLNINNKGHNSIIECDLGLELTLVKCITHAS